MNRRPKYHGDGAGDLAGNVVANVTSHETSSIRRQQDVIDGLPAHLRPFAALQDYRQYTPRDQAVWRFLLHQLKNNLRYTAHPVYLEGLAKTGICQDSIPRIEDMNHCLQGIGWRAVVVDGFIPPAVFMAFQAHRVLAIARDIRSIEHMLYTPAPDIVHESAGHAPFIVDIDYAEFLQRFGELGMRAISSRGDLLVYAAIRHLSIIKEAHSSSTADLAAAEWELQTAIASNSTLSEAALLARLHWWTVEYGLVGEMDDYRLFGAGLLSSLGESVNCLDDQRVRKIPLTVDAIEKAYDITAEQPQLFVTKSCRHLSQVLEEFGRQMCVHRGGASALEQAIEAQTINTVVTSSGVEVSGRFSRLIKDAVGNAVYMQTTGPSQLSYQGKVLPDHGITSHRAGFGSPTGRLKAMEWCLSVSTVDELKAHGIATNERVDLQFLSGINVQGKLLEIVRCDQKNLILSFEDCRVSTQNGELLFDPAWGVYDMAVGESIVSVYGGSADQQAFPIYAQSCSRYWTPPHYDESTRKLFSLYARVRTFRQSGAAGQPLQALLAEIQQQAAQEWLLLFEALELGLQHHLESSCWRGLLTRLEQLAREPDPQRSRLIAYGLERILPAATLVRPCPETEVSI